MARFHETFDLLITPAIAITAFDARLEAPEGHPTVPAERWKPFSAPFNLSGQPAAAVPCGVTAEGLPVAVQIVGPRFSDALVLQAARAFETVCPRPETGLDATYRERLDSKPDRRSCRYALGAVGL